MCDWQASLFWFSKGKITTSSNLAESNVQESNMRPRQGRLANHYGWLVSSSDSKDLSEQKKNVDFKKKANILIRRRKISVMKRDVTEVLLDAKVLRDGPNNAAWHDQGSEGEGVGERCCVALLSYLNCICGAVVIPFFFFLDLLDFKVIGKIFYLKWIRIFL